MNGVRPRRVIGAISGALLASLVLLAPLAGAAARPAPRAARMALAVRGAFSVGHDLVTVPGRSFQIRGVERPYAPGQRVLVQEYLGGRRVARHTVSVRRSPGGTYGWFAISLTSPGAGEVEVTAGHRATTALRGFRAVTHVGALDPNVGFGAGGPFVALMQQRLAALHFYIPQTGVYDTGTGLALDAYHRLLHWGTYQTLDSRTVTWLLNGWGSFPIRYPGDGKHAEGNLGLQLLALIDHGQVRAIYPISSGKPSTPTILGRYHVYLKTPGYLPDGMYYSNFFTGGYAIHGYDPAPDYPASHGCMRVPIVDAISIYNWIAIGDGVDTYY
jgi:hypothetical protein